MEAHIVSLVLHSKKALQHAEVLCSRANTLSKASSHIAVDVLALDAKIKWITDGAMEQLKLAAIIAKNITQQQTKLQQEAKEWDSTRTEGMASLDRVLESLGEQVVPPSLHQIGSGSSLFGSHHSDRLDSVNGRPSAQKSLPLPETSMEGATDRASWKTLRDFVDERSIEDAMERMEQDRTMLDDLLASTCSHPPNLTKQINAIRVTLPEEPAPSVVGELISTQESISTAMAGHLVSLTRHYEQMAIALKERDAGEEIAEEDMQVFVQDSAELPSIIAELEESITAIESINQQLSAAEQTSQGMLETLQTAISSLEELGELMEVMLDEQHQVETEAAALHVTLRTHLAAMSELEDTYVKYQIAYRKLVVEMGRRQKYREAVENIVGGMVAQLDAMRNEEISHRDTFFKSQGAFLPEDLCPYVADLPAKWELYGVGEENVADIDSTFLTEIKARLEPSPAPMES